MIDNIYVYTYVKYTYKNKVLIHKLLCIYDEANTNITYDKAIMLNIYGDTQVIKQLC